MHYDSITIDTLNLFSTCTNPIIHLFTPQKFCIIIVCNFSWDMKMSQGKSKTMPMQMFLGGRSGVLWYCASREYYFKNEFLLFQFYFKPKLSSRNLFPSDSSKIRPKISPRKSGSEITIVTQNKKKKNNTVLKKKAF